MNRQLEILKIGQLWINDQDYIVKILDFGIGQVWLLYPNGNKTAWSLGEFFEYYTIWEDVKP